MAKLMVANWKSNKNTHEVGEWLTAFHKLFEIQVALGKVPYDVVICPAFPFILQVGDWIKKTPYQQHVSLGIQDISPFGAGSYTGAVSSENLVQLDVKYAIVGHSERRKYFKESSIEVSKKVESCLEEGITPILCVDRFEIQQQASFINRESYHQLVVAFEPISHIGTGIPESLNEVLAAMKEVRHAFPDAKVIYGGSLTPENVAEYAVQKEIDGFLVGASSLNAEKFVEMLKV